MKRKCVLGVLKTELGLKIKEEMLAWLSPLYDVETIEVDPPNNELFELPFIKRACEVAVESHEPVLYIHTKGAAMPNNCQPIVRAMWEDAFASHSEFYFSLVNQMFPAASAPFVNSAASVCWYNGFVMNPAAARNILEVLKPHQDRYWFEQGMLAEAGVKAMGPTETADGNITTRALLEYYKRIPPKAKHNHKTACVVLAKDEGPYIEEWLKYHTELGIDKFFVINNNDIPAGDEYEYDMTFQKQLSEKYPVQFFQLYGQDALSIAGKQRGVLNHFYFNVIKPMNEFDWVTFIDIDEFLYLGGKSLKEFLSQQKFADTDVIHLNWRCYGDNGQIYQKDEPVQERFKVQAPLDCVYNSNEAKKGVTEDMFLKSIFRVTDKKTVITNPHTIFIENGVCRSADGQLSDCRYAAERPKNIDCYVKHYITKSLQEFIQRRCMNPTDVANTPIDAKTRLEWYFNLNEKTPEKVEYVKKVLGINV